MSINSLTLIICTYKRERFLSRCLDSVARLRRPPGFRFELAVADNNPESAHDAYIGRLLDALDMPTHYGHEPVAGYSSARNLGLRLALATKSEIFAFVDDDMVLDEGWLEGQCRTYAELEADAADGPIRGHVRERPQGSSLAAAGMANFSFRRHWVEPRNVTGGLGLAFDPEFNQTGYEDRNFTQAAVALGQKIVFSHYSVIEDPALVHGSSLDEARNKADLAIVAAHNNVVRLRRAGDTIGVVRELAKAFHYGLKSLGLGAQGAYYRLAGDSERSALSKISFDKERGKMRRIFTGLRGDYISRQDVRRND